MRTAVLALGLLLLLLVPETARADLSADLERLNLAWSTFGRVQRVAPRLLERGDVVPLLLPAEFSDPTTHSCVTVVLLSPISIHFLVDAQSQASDFEGPESSLAGAVQITRCGARKATLGRITVEMRSPRGVLETLLLTSEAEPPPLVKVLPHRHPGPIAPLAGAGQRPAAAPLPLRLKAIQEYAAREAAVEHTAVELTASLRGTGEQLVALGPGCYRLDLLADETTGLGRHRTVDLDLDVLSAQTGELLASDRSESTDATVTVCTGRPAPVSVRYRGAAPRASIRLVRTRWDLERRLPSDWDPEALGQFSAVLRRFRIRLDEAGLVDTSLGVQGSTAIPFEAEAGACYVAAVVRLRGSLHGLALAGSVGAVHSQNRAVGGAPGTALAFCATTSGPGLIEIDSRGLGLVWMSAVWQSGRVRLGEEAW